MEAWVPRAGVLAIKNNRVSGRERGGGRGRRQPCSIALYIINDSSQHDVKPQTALNLKSY